jgi:hypothetical protein
MLILLLGFLVILVFAWYWNLTIFPFNIVWFFVPIIALHALGDWLKKQIQEKK